MGFLVFGFGLEIGLGRGEVLIVGEIWLLYDTIGTRFLCERIRHFWGHFFKILCLGLIILLGKAS